MWQTLADDLYHRLLRLSWTRLILLFGGLYALLCTAFGAAFFALDGAVVGVDPDSFLDHVWFSVQTVSTIGYGDMQPQTTLAHVLVGIESFFGVMGFALATGIVFSKFSRPTARVRFSDQVTIHDRDGVRTLHLRIANERSTEVVEASVSIYLIRDEINEEGQRMRRFYPLELERSQTPMFSYSFTVMHQLDEDSPLHDVTPETLDEQLTNLVVTFTGIDDTMASDVHARHMYAPEDVVFEERFVDILELEGPGEPESLDIDRLGETEPVEE
jgi:inward rectifier potassium channel